MKFHMWIAASGLSWMMVSGGAVSADDTPDVAFASYQGFVVQLPQPAAPDGQISLCMVPGAPVLTAHPSINLEQCSTQSPPLVTNSASQIMINGLCLNVAQVPDVGIALDLEPCLGPLDIDQLWSFHGGVIQSQAVDFCLMANGAASGGSFGAVGFGDCTPTDDSSTFAATNLFMPINYPMNFLSSQGFCLTDLKQNYNSDDDDTALRVCASTGTSPSTRPDQEWVAQFIADGSPQGFSSYELLSVADGMALDVFGIASNVGTVDMATPHAGMKQHWYFTVTGNGSQPGFSLLAHGVGAQCLDIQGDQQVKGSPPTPIDTFLCNSQFGNGDNDAQQWQSVIPGFAH
jgi:hypothetical protein